MAQLKDLIVNGPSRFIGDQFLSQGLTSEGNLMPSVDNTLSLGDATHRWKVYGALTGNADTATSLAAAQTVYVTLGTASTSTTIQGGSSSAQTIGVDGTLGISNGGTGTSSIDANKLMYVSGTSITTLANTNITDANTVSLGTGASNLINITRYGATYLKKGALYIDNAKNTIANSVTQDAMIKFRDDSSTPVEIMSIIPTDNGLYFRNTTQTVNEATGLTYLIIRQTSGSLGVESNVNLRPATNGDIDLGSSSYKWLNLHSLKATLYTSSASSSKKTEIVTTAATADKTATLPNTSGWIAMGGNGSSTGVGSADQIVYMANTGVLTAGTSATDANTVSTIVKRDSSGNFSAGTITAALSGNASTATGANLTTTANAVAYYTDTAGTFGTIASASGALYATAANGALNFGTLPVSQGGTGGTSFTKNRVIMSGSSNTGAFTTRAVVNNTSSTAAAANTYITTQNTLYYSQALINGASQQRSVSIYAPTSEGTAGQILVSGGSGNAPTWSSDAVSTLFFQAGNTGVFSISDVSGTNGTGFTFYYQDGSFNIGGPEGVNISDYSLINIVFVSFNGSSTSNITEYFFDSLLYPINSSINTIYYSKFMIVDSETTSYEFREFKRCLNIDLNNNIVSCTSNMADTANHPDGGSYEIYNNSQYGRTRYSALQGDYQLIPYSISLIK